ncbi:MAG: HD domain-containing protein [Clostridia bacterium]|nr:HD domain-containing protein [Clostridia bacterium]
MFKNMTYTDIYQSIITEMKAKKSQGVDSVRRAFELAERAHSGQTRKDGQPYVIHVVSVAYILERLNFDSDTICAALLHDVIEDCGITVDELREQFGDIVAGVVDAVSAIEEKDYTFDDDLFDDENNLKASIDNKTYEKLLSMGIKNRLAFIIKLADRLHNLSTIETFSYAKQLEKVKETERWILPIANLIQSEYFYRNIKNLIFSIKNKQKLKNYFEAKEIYYKQNETRQAETKEQLSLGVEALLKRLKKQNLKANIVSEMRQDYLICNDILKNVDISEVRDIKLSHFNKVSTMNLYLCFSGKISQKECMEILIRLLNENKIKENIKIIGFKVDKRFGVPFLIVKDKSRNRYRITAMTTADYTIFTNGSLFGADIENIQTKEITEVASEYINVYTRSGELMRIEKNATVLDFAFKLHQDLGFSCKYALINKSNTKQPLYTKLIEGDMVSLICEQDEETGEKKNIAKIRWLAYVKTEYAQRFLIRYFEKQLG